MATRGIKSLNFKDIKPHRYLVLFKPKLFERLKEEAIKQGVSYNAIIHKAIEFYLENKKD